MSHPEKLYDINYSASDLLKSSAAQIVYKKNRMRMYNEKEKPTKRQLKGNENAERVSTSELIEMRGTYVFKKHLIHFTFDEIQKKDDHILFIEHKFIDDENNLEDWYINSSLLQTALYQALAMKTKEYITAKFMRKTHEVNYLEIKKKEKRRSELLFSNENFMRRYEVIVTDPKKLIKFFTDKLKYTLIDGIKLADSYEKAREWDKKFKRKEFELLKDTFTYKVI